MQEPDNPGSNQPIPQGNDHTQVTEGQTSVPGQTPTPGYVPVQTPAQGLVPGQTPTQTPGPGCTPGQTPTQGHVPGQTPAQGHVPGQTPALGYAPGQTPIQGQVTGQTPAPGYVAGQTPGPGYTPGQIPGPGYAPGQTQIPVYVPGQTPGPAYAPGQTPGPAYAPGQIPVPGQTPAQGNATGQPTSATDDFTHVYRTGNFGKHYGKVNATRGKRYAIVHGVLSLLMIIFTITATDMMKHYIPGPIKDRLVGVSWLCAVFDGLSTLAAFYFMWTLPTLTHPLSTLVVMKIFAAFSMFINVFFFLIGALSAMMKKEDFIGLKENEINLLKAIYAIITILMVMKIFTSTAFIFHWWNCFPSNPTACACFAPYCIFEEGEDLAPGVPNAPGVQNIRRAFGLDR